MSIVTDSSQRTVTLSVKISPEEQHLLRMAAAKRNISVSQYIRLMILPRAEREIA